MRAKSTYTTVSAFDSDALSTTSNSFAANDATLSASDNQIIEILFNILNSMYSVVVPDPNDVKEYLNKYFGLTDILLPICKQIRNTFKKPAQLILGVYHDPEINYEYLYVYIRLYDYSWNFMEKIDDIEDAYSREIIKTNGWLSITTDFNTPENL